MPPTPRMMTMDNEDMSPFHLVSQTFARIGLLTIDQFLQAPADINDCGGWHHYYDRTPTPPAAHKDKVDSNASGLAVADANKVTCITQLHQACQRAFGRTDVLKYEFIEVDGPSAKQCILTITRPGPSISTTNISTTNARSYTTPTTYPRKSEAKAHTSALAISLGALEFITTGFTKAESAASQSGLMLEPLKAHDDAPPDGAEQKSGKDDGEVDEGARRIERCWSKWRGDLRNRPGWVEYDSKPRDSGYGVALRIELSRHCFRVYSTDTIYATTHEAKSACAAQAIDQGVLEFIKFGNGQTHPPTRLLPSSPGPSNSNTNTNTKPSPITLQSYYESLPRPFPENVPSAATPAEINAPSWLNTTLQTARGAKLSAQYIWLISPKSSATILHGCLLRVLRPSHPPLSYLLPPLFQKRADAKSAVCLQAISQGIGEYIRGVVRELDEKVTTEMRRVAGEFYAGLGEERKKLGVGFGGVWEEWAKWEFEKDKDAFGCTLTVELPNSEAKKSWSVPTEYRTKADAKVAVAYAASEGGAIEFLKFRGKEPPTGYRSWYSAVMSGEVTTSSSSGIGGKRRERDIDSCGVSNKKARMSTPLLETKEEALERVHVERKNAGFQARNQKPGRRDKTTTYTNNAGMSYENSGNGAELELTGHSVPSRVDSSHLFPPSPAHSWLNPSVPPAGYTPGSFYPPPPPGAASFWNTQQYYPGPLTPAPTHFPPHAYANYVVPYPPQLPPATRYHHPIARPPSLPSPLYAYGPPCGPTPLLHHYVGQLSLPPAYKPPPGTLPQKLNSSPAESHPSWQKSSHPISPKDVQDPSKVIPSFPKSHFASLKEYCAHNQITPPQWHNSGSKNRYKVWCTMESERMELAVDFASIDEGKERVSKQVLNRLRSKEKLDSG